MGGCLSWHGRCLFWCGRLPRQPDVQDCTGPVPAAGGSRYPGGSAGTGPATIHRSCSRPRPHLRTLVSKALAHLVDDPRSEHPAIKEDAHRYHPDHPGVSRSTWATPTPTTGTSAPAGTGVCACTGAVPAAVDIGAWPIRHPHRPPALTGQQKALHLAAPPLEPWRRATGSPVSHVITQTVLHDVGDRDCQPPKLTGAVV